MRYSEKTVRVVVTIKENFAVSKVDEGKKLSFTAKNVSDAKKIKGVKPTLKNKIKKSTIDDSANIKKVVVEFEDKPKYEKSSYVDMGVRFCIYNFPNTGLKENDWHLPTDLGSEIEQVSIVSFNPQTARIVIRVPENIGIKETVKDNEIIFVDSLALTDIKTKQAVRVMENLAKATGFKSLANSKKKRVLIAIYGRSEKTEKSFRNLPQLELVFLKNLNPLDVLNYQYLVIENPKESIEFLESRG